MGAKQSEGGEAVNRLINENDVIQRLETVYGLRGAVKSETLQAIDACPTVDAERVVRCCECRHARIGYTYGKPAWAECRRECNYGTGKILPLDWFCAGGNYSKCCED